MRRRRRISESYLRRVIKENIRRCLHEAEENDSDICRQVFSKKSGETVWDILSEILDSETVHTIADRLADEGYTDAILDDDWMGDELENEDWDDDEFSD